MKFRWKKFLAAPFVLIAAIIVILEDWLWDDLQRLAAAFGRLPVLRQLESLIASLPPYGALAMFGAPSLLLIPVKLAALWLISHGQATVGFLVVVIAKVVGTALVARIYTLTEPKLLLIGWFVWLHTRFVAFKSRVYNTIKASRIYQRVHRQSQMLKERFRQLMKSRKGVWKRRWDAAVKLSRRGKRSAE